ncbi:SLC38A6, partial [Symbiodinium microadriaticum]
VSGLILFFVVASFLVALEVRSLGLVNVLDGALCVGVFTALAPGLVGLLLMDRQSFAWKSAMYLLLAGGIAMSVLGLVFTQNEPELLAQACKLPHPADVSIGMIQTDLRITTT